MVRPNKKPTDGVLGPVRGLQSARYAQRPGEAKHPTEFMATPGPSSLPGNTSAVTHSGLASGLNNLDVTPRLYI